MTTMYDVHYLPAHGIAPRHWNDLQEYAARTHLAVVLRGGKEKAIPWIELGYPAKPLTMKAKVDRKTGLLRCGVIGDAFDLLKDKEHRQAAFQAGLWVLDPDPAHPSRFLARSSERAGLPAATFESAQHQWLRAGAAGLVVDPHRRLPFTSDYDIAAVVDTQRFNYALTYGSIAGRSDRSNPLTEATRQELNRIFGSERIVHGTQAQYEGSPINDPSDTLIAFHPTGHVDVMSQLTHDQATRLLIAVILGYHPDQAHVFRQ